MSSAFPVCLDEGALSGAFPIRRHRPPQVRFHPDGAVGCAGDPGPLGRGRDRDPLGPIFPREGGGSGPAVDASCTDEGQPDRTILCPGHRLWGFGWGAAAALGAFRRYGDVPRLIGVSISVGPPRHVRSRERLQPPMGDLHSRGYDPHRLRAEYGDPLFDPLGVRTSTDCCGPASGECGVSSFFM